MVYINNSETIIYVMEIIYIYNGFEQLNKRMTDSGGYVS